MSKVKLSSVDKKKLEKAESRLSEIQETLEQIPNSGDYKILDEVSPLGVEREKLLRKVLKLRKKAGTPGDLALPLANICSVLADKNPSEALGYAKEFDDLDIKHEERVEAFVAAARHIAYKGLDDPVRARQWGAIANRLHNNVEEDSGDANAFLIERLKLALRSAHSKPEKLKRKCIIKVSRTKLNSWLEKKPQISLSDLGPGIGEFLSNKQQFHRDATELLEMLVQRLQGGVSKPDNYLLHADPGSGKSFFVKEFASQLEKSLLEKKFLKKDADERLKFLERNLSAYSNMEIAFNDIFIDTLIALTTHKVVLLFIDEVDTELDGQSMFQRLIAPINGDPFFFREKQVSFKKQNLVVFFALSRTTEDVEKENKFPDFLSRIPNSHQIKLPEFTDPIDRIYRAVVKLRKKPFRVKRVQAAALLYIGLRPWASVREMNQALDLAKMRNTKSTSHTLELADVAVSPQDVNEVAEISSVDIWSGPVNELQIT